jgi:hypothetical protein
MRIRRYVLAALLAGASMSAAGCLTPVGSGPTDPVTSVGSAPSAGPSPLVLASDQAAAEHLYEAWQANDEQAALQGATSAAVEALFARDWGADTYFWGGCTGPDLWECQYNSAQGVVIIMKTDGDSTAGWKVVSVSFGNAG